MTACSAITGIESLLNLVPQRTETAALPSLETQLVTRARAGDDAAFRSLVEMHQAAIHRFCSRWIGCWQDAQELSQDTFVRAWTALPDYQCSGRFEAWLYRIALNLCRDHAKSRATRDQRATVSLDASISDSQECPRLPPDLSLEWQGDMRKLERGLAALPERLRLPLILCTIESLPQDKCAEVLCCSTRAVEGRLRRARERLLEWWNKNA